MVKKFYFFAFMCSNLFSSNDFNLKKNVISSDGTTSSSPSSSSSKRNLDSISSSSSNLDMNSARFLIVQTQPKTVSEKYEIESPQDKANRDYPNLAKVEINRCKCFIKYFSVIDDIKEDVLIEIYNLILNFEYRNDLALIYDQFRDFSTEQIKKINDKNLESRINLNSKFDQLKARLTALQAEISVNESVELERNRNSRNRSNNTVIVNQPRNNLKIIGMFCLFTIVGLIIALSVKYKDSKNTNETMNKSL